LECADDTEAYEVASLLPAPTISCGVEAQSWIVLRLKDSARAATPAQFTAELKFHVVEVDPNTSEIEGDHDGFAEEYPLEDLELMTSDFIIKATTGDFKRLWEANKAGEVLAKFALQFKDMQSAISAVITCLGMQ